MSYPSWMERAECSGTGIEFFPPCDTDVARALCRRCDVQSDCLEYALIEGLEYGIWGGQTESQRRGEGILTGTCRGCGVEFELPVRRGPRAVYCSPECKKAGRNAYGREYMAQRRHPTKAAS